VREREREREREQSMRDRGIPQDEVCSRCMQYQLNYVMSKISTRIDA